MSKFWTNKYKLIYKSTHRMNESGDKIDAHIVQQNNNITAHTYINIFTHVLGLFTNMAYKSNKPIEDSTPCGTNKTVRPKWKIHRGNSE